MQKKEKSLKLDKTIKNNFFFSEDTKNETFFEFLPICEFGQSIFDEDKYAKKQQKIIFTKNMSN